MNDIPFLNSVPNVGPSEGSLPAEDGYLPVDDGSGEETEANDDGSGSGSGSGLPAPEGSGVQNGRERNPMDGWFPGEEVARRERELFDSLGCREHFMIAKKARTDPMPKECERLLYSISFLTFQVM